MKLVLWLVKQIGGDLQINRPATAIGRALPSLFRYSRNLRNSAGRTMDPADMQQRIAH